MSSHKCDKCGQVVRQAHKEFTTITFEQVGEYPEQAPADSELRGWYLLPDKSVVAVEVGGDIPHGAAPVKRTEQTAPVVPLWRGFATIRPFFGGDGGIAEVVLVTKEAGRATMRGSWHLVRANAEVELTEIQTAAEAYAAAMNATISWAKEAVK